MDNYIMIGGNLNNRVFNYCINQAELSSNVDFLGQKSFFNTTEYFAKAKYVLCKSEYEGFPNTFLQAWSYCNSRIVNS